MDIIEFDHEKYDLKNLLDAKHPFLERFRDKAPGTYKHSQNVASLCESVALELDLSPDVMKVLGTYHDVGKMYHPDYFYENQSDNNPHDKLDPMISFHLLSRHISDGALILVQMEDFPNELIEPIVQHHGNSIIKSLANKSKLDEEMFRYKNTCPPKTLESAVLMICDSVEATIRSKEFDQESLDSEKIREIILNTIDRLESDDQLDEIRLGDLKSIKRALAKDLESKYHKRDSKAYDDEDNKKIKEIK
jgi:putative nucleotidyltransferase with HDIG domain